MKGLEAPSIKNKVALRVSVTGSIFMDSVRVPHDHILPNGQGLNAPFSCLNSARYVCAPLEDDGRFIARVGTAYLGVQWVRSRIVLPELLHMRLSESNSSDLLHRSSLYKRNWSMPRLKSPWVYKPAFRLDASRRLVTWHPRWSAW